MDPYAVLGVARDASPEDIKRAFRELARQHHPDRNPEDSGAQKRFQDINSAYQLLSDPARRRNFDRFGSDGGSSRPTPGPSGFGGFPGGFGGSVNIEDLFGEVFGGRGAAVSLDVEAAVDLAFEEAALGCTKTIQYDRLDSCDRCAGEGCEPGTQRARCRTCQGRGRVAVAAFGLFQLGAERPCPACAGLGSIPATPCGSCAGSGVRMRSRKLDVTVPPGIEHGARQSVRGGGNRATGGQSVGDLELLIRVRAHREFQRQADEVMSELALPFVTATLGGPVTVTTLHGPVTHVVPSGTQAGTVLRLKGQGIPHRFRRGRGDHLLKVSVTIPTRLSARAEELVRQLDGELREDSSGSMFSRIKNWF